MTESTDPRVPDMRNREALLVHIEGLQAVITKRNAQIENQTAQLTAGAATDIAKRAVQKAYKQGWKDCAGRMTETTRQAAMRLREVSGEAYKVYLEGDRLTDALAPEQTND